MSKLIPDTNNKLLNTENPVIKHSSNKIPEHIALTKESRTNSFSLRKKDKERLFDLIDKVQIISERKITATDLLRGLLISGCSMKSEDLLSCVQKSFIE